VHSMHPPGPALVIDGRATEEEEEEIDGVIWMHGRSEISRAWSPSAPSPPCSPAPGERTPVSCRRVLGICMPGPRPPAAAALPIRLVHWFGESTVPMVSMACVKIDY
jgi:hypothetical protein